MKKILILIIILILMLVFSACNTNDCHNCKGYNAGYRNYIDRLLQQNQINYNRYAELIEKANTCNIVVCGADYCDEHSKR